MDKDDFLQYGMIFICIMIIIVGWVAVVKLDEYQGALKEMRTQAIQKGYAEWHIEDGEPKWSWK